LQFAESEELKRFTCDGCSKLNQKRRKCENDGFENVPKGQEIKINNAKFRFCPAKASWYEDMVDLYHECELAALTGIMPNRGEFKDQDEIFSDVLPHFVKRWDEKRYHRKLKDGQKILGDLANAIFGEGKKNGTK